MDKKGQEKKERLLTALEKGMVMIHLDARRPGVVVPPNVRSEPHLRLNLSYNFDPPDLSVGEWGVRSTLSFRGVRFTVAIPWSALFAITSHVTKEFWMYPGDIPPELIESSTLAARQPPAIPEPEGSPKAILREVVAEPPAEEKPEEEPPRPRGRGHLRVVK
jgi:stringent starvation protein B